MSLTGNNGLLAAAGANQPAYSIDESLRFNDNDSAFLSKAYASSGNRKTWTWSGWVKRSELGSATPNAIFSSDTGPQVGALEFPADDTFTFYDYTIGGSYQSRLVTTALYRDPSSWYHVVVSYDTTQATSSNRIKIYINGSQVTDFSTETYPSQDLDGYINYGNNSRLHGLGKNTGLGDYLDGYLAEVHFIDGTALDASSFGETNSDTNQWVPIKYSGSYGTNGFYLDFSNSGSLGTDGSGNGNNFTSTNLASTDQVLDSPTNNFSTINALTESVSNRNDFHEGNLRATANDISGNSSAWFTATMGIPPNTGKWYWEFADEIYIDAGNFDGSYPDGWGMGLLADDGHAKLFADTDISNTGWWFSKSNNNVGTVRARGGSTSSENKRVPSTSTGVFKCCYDSDAGSFWFGGDLGWMTKTSTGTPETSDQPGSGNDLWDSGTGVGFSGYTVIPAWATINAGGNLTQLRFNFGQDSTFAGIRSGVSGTAGNPSGGGYGGNTDANGYGDFFYEVPTGFKALCTDNLPDATITTPSEYFNAITYTGNGTSPQARTGLGHKPSFLWIKDRGASNNHVLTDAIRGPNGAGGLGQAGLLYSNATTAEVTGASQVKSYDTDGFTTHSTTYVNVNTNTYVAWSWKGSDTPSKTYAVTVTNPGSGNRYTLDGRVSGTNAMPITLEEGGTYTFDQSDSSNGGHPLRFSTTSNGTHGGGSEYTTGVTTNGVPGQAGAYTRITVAASAPTLYYYCTAHSGMGAEITTPGSSGGVSDLSGTIASVVNANTTAGFSIVGYTGTGSNSTVGHGLSVAPELIIVRNRDMANEWPVGATAVSSNYSDYLALDKTRAKLDDDRTFNDTAPTASVFSVGTYDGTNESADKHIAYCFHSVEGYSKIGAYTGNANSDGTFVYTGFRPAWLLVKCHTTTDNWLIMDATRNTYNVINHKLYPNVTDAEADESVLDFTSNGFKWRNGGSLFNGNETYVYYAIAETPFKTSNAR